MFKTIKEATSAEVVEKKSKFIANIYYIESVQEAEKLVKQANKKYFDARHNCYAFSVMTDGGMINRFSDDGEPSGTAGAPMLNILNSRNLCNVLVIVTRYFGGILLGTGGLVRAYTEAITEALKAADIVEKEQGKEVKFCVAYSDLEKCKYYLKQMKAYVSNIEYNENVWVSADLTQENYNEILKNKEQLNFKILDLKLIKDKFVTVTANYE